MNAQMICATATQQPSAANRLEFRIEGEIDRRAILTRPKNIRPDDPRWKAWTEKLAASEFAAGQVPAITV